MGCEHDEAEKDVALVDGVCPLCLNSNIQSAIDFIFQYGGIDGSHHKQWTLDQVLRILTDNNYENLVKEYMSGEDGKFTYDWDEGIAP
jgi:hypothetical protein